MTKQGCKLDGKSQKSHSFPLLFGVYIKELYKKSLEQVSDYPERKDNIIQSIKQRYQMSRVSIGK